MKRRTRILYTTDDGQPSDLNLPPLSVVNEPVPVSARAGISAEQRQQSDGDGVWCIASDWVLH